MKWKARFCSKFSFQKQISVSCQQERKIPPWGYMEASQRLTFGLLDFTEGLWLSSGKALAPYLTWSQQQQLIYPIEFVYYITVSKDMFGKVKFCSHVWLCYLMDCSLPGSPVHGLFQASVLQWVATSFSRGSRSSNQTQVSHIAGRCFTTWATREAHPVSNLCFPTVLFRIAAILFSPHIIDE